MVGDNSLYCTTAPDSLQAARNSREDASPKSVNFRVAPGVYAPTQEERQTGFRPLLRFRQRCQMDTWQFDAIQRIEVDRKAPDVKKWGERASE